MQRRGTDGWRMRWSIPTTIEGFFMPHHAINQDGADKALRSTIAAPLAAAGWPPL